MYTGGGVDPRERREACREILGVFANSAMLYRSCGEHLASAFLLLYGSGNAEDDRPGEI